MALTLDTTHLPRSADLTPSTLRPTPSTPTPIAPAPAGEPLQDGPAAARPTAPSQRKAVPLNAAFRAGETQAPPTYDEVVRDFAKVLEDMDLKIGDLSLKGPFAPVLLRAQRLSESDQRRFSATAAKLLQDNRTVILTKEGASAALPGHEKLLARIKAEVALIDYPEASASAVVARSAPLREPAALDGWIDTMANAAKSNPQLATDLRAVTPDSLLAAAIELRGTLTDAEKKQLEADCQAQYAVLQRALAA